MEKKIKRKRKIEFPKDDEIIRDVKVNCYDYSDETYINVKPKEHLKMKRGNFEEVY